jgi:hypothetical protein
MRWIQEVIAILTQQHVVQDAARVEHVVEFQSWAFRMIGRPKLRNLQDPEPLL